MVTCFSLGEANSNRLEPSAPNHSQTFQYTFNQIKMNPFFMMKGSVLGCILSILFAILCKICIK